MRQSERAAQAHQGLQILQPLVDSPDIQEGDPQHVLPGKRARAASRSCEGVQRRRAGAAAVVGLAGESGEVGRFPEGAIES